MCGITGVFQLDGSVPDEALTRRMAAAMHHRGPDDEGFFSDRGVSLGFRRLSIIDLSGGHQPMTATEGRFTIVFNGEIYNFQDLRRTLEGHGATFATHSDTEVILAAYRQWGTDAIARLNGMFALALWDAQEGSLLLARDRLGKKPLFWTRVPGGICFGSEVKVLFEHPAVPRRVDPRLVPTFLAYRYVPGKETLFEGVESLPPATWMRVSARGGVEAPRRYWDYDFRDPPAPSSPGEVREKFRDLLLDSVRLRRIADVPVGAFLSGGLDSSVVVGLMTRLHPEPLKTFSVGFDTGFSEVEHARTVARAFGTDHHEVLVSSSDLIATIPQVLHARETPITNTSDVPIHLLARLARTKVTVVLSGEGSDEILAGYPKYAFEHQVGPALRRLPSPLVRAAAAAIPARLQRVRFAVETAAERDRLDRYARWFGAFTRAESAALLSPEHAGHGGLHATSEALLSGKSFPSAVEEMLYLDTAHWLSANLLLRGDRLSMASSLELRCPFLDYRLVEMAAGEIPRSMKIHGLSGKQILKDVALSILPPEIVNRPKWGFKVPTAEWFRGPLSRVLRDVLLSRAARSRGYFREERVRALVDDHVAGRRNNEQQLWALLQLELWHLMFVDRSLGPSDTLG